MKSTSLKKCISYLTKIFLPVFAVIVIWGVFLSMPASTNQMADCPFMPGEKAICDMNAIDHLTQWEQTFAATVKDNFEIFAALILLSLAVGVWLLFKLFAESAPPLHLNFQKIKKQNRLLNSYHYQQQNLSRGKILPKRYP